VYEIAIPFIIIGIIISLLGICYLLGQQHYPLRLFYIVISLFLMLSLISMPGLMMTIENTSNFSNSEIKEADTSMRVNLVTVYRTMITTVVITLFYIVIYYLVVLLSSFGKVGGSRGRSLVQGEEEEDE